MSDGPFFYRFHDFHEAYLASHQLEIEGCRTVVLDNGVSYLYGPFVAGGFRVMAFDPDSERIDEPFEATETFATRFLRVAAVLFPVAALLVCGLSLIHQSQSPFDRERMQASAAGAFVVIAMAALMILFQFIIGPPIFRVYQAYRRGDVWAQLLFLGIGWFAILPSFPPVLAIPFLVWLFTKPDSDQTMEE